MNKRYLKDMETGIEIKENGLNNELPINYYERF